MNCFSNMFKCCRQSSLDNLSMSSFTYGVGRFTKNAMLLICQVTSEMGGKNKDQVLKDMEIVKNTFQKYRFEPETYVDLTSSEIEEVCSKFFARDFSEYGAIAVVILAQNGGPGTFMARDKMYDEANITKYLKYEETGSLSGKPKVYITEANRVSTTTGKDIQYSVPMDDEYRHVLGFHIPLIMEEVSPSPLEIFCDRMSNPHLEDYFVLLRIIYGAVQDIEEAFPSLRGRIETTNTAIAAFTLPCD